MGIPPPLLWTFTIYGKFTLGRAGNVALAMVLGAGVVVLIRALAIHYHWKLPRIKNPDKVGIK